MYYHSRTELFNVMTTYNEDDTPFMHTAHGVMKIHCIYASAITARLGARMTKRRLPSASSDGHQKINLCMLIIIVVIGP